MQSTRDLIAARFAQTPPPSVEKGAVAIENIVGINTNGLRTSNTSIELPEEISSLITGSAYWVRAKSNRYKKLVREGHLKALLHLAKLARARANQEDPSHYFAHAASVARWETYTLPFLTKALKVADLAERVARKLSVPVAKFIYKQIWAGKNVERWAALAEEIPHLKPGQGKARYFNWLCQREAVA